MFHDNWYSEDQLAELAKAVRQVIIRGNLKGKVIEIGCWEGKSTVTIATECFPENLDAVDTWQGNVAEGPQHVSVIAASQRDVFEDFTQNMKILTKGNVTPVRRDCFEYLNSLDEEVKFCHVDAAHDYKSVRRTLELLLPKLVHGAVMCGDDYESANVGRKDLDGGVQRAVIEMLPFHGHKGNFWWYKHSLANRAVRSSARLRSLLAFIRRII